MGARNRGGIGLSFRPVRLHRRAEMIHWNRFLGRYDNTIPTRFLAPKDCYKIFCGTDVRFAYEKTREGRLLKLRGMGTQRVHRKGVLPWLFRLGLSCRYNSFCSALAALVSPVQNIFFLAVHYFNSFVSHRPASWAGSRAGSPIS
jgi:hypothetical protein